MEPHNSNNYRIYHVNIDLRHDHYGISAGESRTFLRAKRPHRRRARRNGYRKTSKISPRAYIFEGLIFGGAYGWREICVIKSVGLACSGKEIYHFCFVLLCIRGQIPSTSPPGAYIRRGDLTEGFLRYDFGGLIFGGAYTWRGLFSEFLRYLVCGQRCIL